MKKKLALMLVFVLLIASLAACAPSKTEDTSSEEPLEATNGDAGYKWPVKTIELIVPASAGGDTDFNARTMAKYFEEATGVTMIVTNMTGGGGTIATSHVKESRPDGSVMFFGHTGQLLVNEVAGLADYGVEDFDIVAVPAVDKSTVFVVSADSGITSVADLAEASKSKPIVYGSELGGYTHLQGLIYGDLTGTDLNVVDVGPAAEKITNLLGGRIDLMSIAYGAVQDYVTTGDMVIIGQVSATRNELLGDIPTIVEQGYDFAMDKPYIAAYPKGTDAQLIAQIVKVMEDITSNNKSYAQELENTYKQPITFFNSEDATALLKELRDDYMNYADLLR
ncbi:Tripartite-type tricarboxylate transporter, receptor component TctC [Anaerovirgula multivorans]|uniref:Tripartite-type tricarboxylate transporter, receptor component TctC n=1 Tax=Anaerovirgula multivorans TaxID=312168 RepID=A0A239HZK5_9FIRM|nr:tripartite tricarboxylate transporter substrate binding protein [Anaerovirgula multivorans]SNS85694.1 Tripartite-type tricarboxylate transporter, receptor component TctC [Anaerovirgula multivorans]